MRAATIECKSYGVLRYAHWQHLLLSQHLIMLLLCSLEPVRKAFVQSGCDCRLACQLLLKVLQNHKAEYMRHCTTSCSTTATVVHVNHLGEVLLCCVFLRLFQDPLVVEGKSALGPLQHLWVGAPISSAQSQASELTCRPPQIHTLTAARGPMLLSGQGSCTQSWSVSRLTRSYRRPLANHLPVIQMPFL